MTVTTELPTPLDEPQPPPVRRKRRAGPAVLVALALLGAGAVLGQRMVAGGETAHDHGAHSHAPDLDPCTLVTEAEAEAIVGPVITPRAGGLGVVEDQVVCEMRLEGDARFTANVGFADFEVEGRYEGFATRFPGASHEIDDLGDEAVWLDIFRLVMVRVGDELVTVQFNAVFADPAETRDQAIELARIAVARRS